jgi:phosphatidylglycerophosphate synthase
LPSAVTAVRLALVPLLVYLINNEQFLFGGMLFLSLVATDFLDGYLARKLGVSSKFSAYFDATADFVLIFCLFAAFIPQGFCAEWVLLIIGAVFVEFILTSRSLVAMYDPIGKYFGSLLFGLIALRFFISGQFFYGAVTVVVPVSAAASILSRVVSIFREHQRLLYLSGKSKKLQLSLIHTAESSGRIALDTKDS